MGASYWYIYTILYSAIALLSSYHEKRDKLRSKHNPEAENEKNR